MAQNTARFRIKVNQIRVQCQQLALRCVAGNTNIGKKYNVSKPVAIHLASLCMKGALLIRL